LSWDDDGKDLEANDHGLFYDITYVAVLKKAAKSCYSG
jgi:hypothetical protein